MSSEKKELQHIGIIMDGNGRWAKSRFLPRIVGHHAGVKALERIIRATAELKIPYLSLYAFSTENWSRPSDEVSSLMGMFEHYLDDKISELHDAGARLRFSGRLEMLPRPVQDALARAEETTKNNDLIQLIVCVNYGGRQELIDAINKIIKSDKIDNKQEITEDILQRHLYLPDVPDPDLIIRTSGELRLSNFLLWESAYSEFYFTDKLWPDFEKEDLIEAINSYNKRNRRYGKI